MRSILFRSALAIAAVAVTWLFAGRRISLLLDHVKTVRMRNFPTAPLEVNLGTLKIGDLYLGLNPSVKVEANAAGRVVLTRDGETLPLGVRDGPEQAFTPDSGDQVTLTVDHSLMSWPTPFEMNFMTGHSASWRRNLYYRLTWIKASAARLEMVWRYEQPFYPSDGWAGGNLEREGVTGLIAMNIRFSRDESSAMAYLERVKGWKPADYRLELRGSDVLRVVYLADEHSPHPGAGQSVELHLDRSTHQIQREVGLQ